MNSKGQGALEYLLLIAGAVLVAAIVISIIVSIPSGGSIDKRMLDAWCAAYGTSLECTGSDPDGPGDCDVGDCAWDSTTYDPPRCVGRSDAPSGCLT